ncbi:MAG: hypothetical protein R2684_11135 [Pyrinomonadaceae bacterium]
MSFEVNNSPYSRFYETRTYGFYDQTRTNAPRISTESLSGFFAALSGLFRAQSGSNAFDSFLRQFLGTGNSRPVENYGGFAFKNDAEKARVDEALAQLRAQQAANPGKPVSTKFKIGKYKYQVSLDENGQVKIKRKKKKRGFFGKIGDAFKKIGKGIMSFAKKALPIVSTLAMFVPGLQPFALAARIATGVMGVVDGIKNGNIFGAVMSGVSALSGVGGKVGTFFSGLTAKAGTALSSFGTNMLSKFGTAGTWLQNAFTSGKGWLDAGKQWLSNWTSGVGTNITNYLSLRGNGLLQSLTNTFQGRLGQWLTEKGPTWVSKFANSMGSRAADWLYNKISDSAVRMLQRPFGPGLRNMVNSGVAQFLMSLLQGRQV